MSLIERRLAEAQRSQASPEPRTPDAPPAEEQVASDGTQDQTDQEQPQEQQPSEEAQALELLQEEGVDLDSLTDDDLRQNVIKGLSAAQRKLADQRKQAAGEVEAMKAEIDQLRSVLQDPKQQRAVSAYHRELQGDDQSQTAQIPNPYGDVHESAEEGDGGWNPNALNASRAVAFDVIKKDLLPPVLSTIAGLKQEIAGLKSQIQMGEVESTLKELGQIDGVDAAEIQKFASERGLTVKQAAFALHGDKIAAANARPDTQNNQSLKPQRPPRKPASNDLPNRLQKRGDGSFEERIESRLEDPRVLKQLQERGLMGLMG